MEKLSFYGAFHQSHKYKAKLISNPVKKKRFKKINCSIDYVNR